MAPQKLSVVLPLAITTGIIGVSMATFGGITFCSTHSLDYKNLKIRYQFNNFLKSEIAKKEHQGYPEDFKAVSDFVKNNGKGTLIAQKKLDTEKYFEFTYYANDLTNTEHRPSKGKIVKNWSAVEQYLKDVAAYNSTNKNSGSTSSRNHEYEKQLQILEEKLQKEEQKWKETKRRYESMFPRSNDNKICVQHPLFYKLTKQEQNQIENKQREYAKINADLMLINSRPISPQEKKIKTKDAEILLYQADRECYELQIKLYTKASKSNQTD